MSNNQACFGFLEEPAKAPESQSRGTVWVDELQDYPTEMVSARAKSHGTRWCHLWANDPESVEELHRIAKACGLKLAYFQNRRGFPHYDLVPSKRAQAIAAGAREKSLREWIMERRRREESIARQEPAPIKPAVNQSRRAMMPTPSVSAPRFAALDPPRSVRVDQRTNRLAVSQPRAFVAVNRPGQ